MYVCVCCEGVERGSVVTVTSVRVGKWGVLLSVCAVRVWKGGVL